jgi:hypothetical protein
MNIKRTIKQVGASQSIDRKTIPLQQYEQTSKINVLDINMTIPHYKSANPIKTQNPGKTPYKLTSCQAKMGT